MTVEGCEDEDELYDQIDRAVSAYTRTPVAHRRRRAYGDHGHAALEDGGPGAARAPTVTEFACAMRADVRSPAGGGNSSRVARKRAAHGEPHEPRRNDRPTARQSTKPPIPRQGRLGNADGGHASTEAAAIREHRARTRALARKIALRYGRSEEGLQAAADLLRTESAEDELDAEDANESSERAAASGPAVHSSVPPVVDGREGLPQAQESSGRVPAGTRAETPTEEEVMHTSTDAEVDEGRFVRASEGALATAHLETYERVLSAAQSGTLSSVLQQECTDKPRDVEKEPSMAIDDAEPAHQNRAVQNGLVPSTREPDRRQTDRTPGEKMPVSDHEGLRDLMAKARRVEEQLSRRLQALVDKERKVSQRSSKLAARTKALSLREAKADDREADLEQRAVSLSKRESAADFARRQSQLSAQEQKVAARLAEANKRVLQAEQAESAAQVAQADLDRREADLAAAERAADRRDALLSDATAATEVRRQMVTEGTLRLTSDADRLR